MDSMLDPQPRAHLHALYTRLSWRYGAPGVRLLDFPGRWMVFRTADLAAGIECAVIDITPPDDRTVKELADLESVAAFAVGEGPDATLLVMYLANEMPLLDDFRETPSTPVLTLLVRSQHIRWPWRATLSLTRPARQCVLLCPTPYPAIEVTTRRQRSGCRPTGSATAVQPGSCGTPLSLRAGSTEASAGPGSGFVLRWHVSKRFIRQVLTLRLGRRRVFLGRLATRVEDERALSIHETAADGLAQQGLRQLLLAVRHGEERRLS